MENPYLRSAFAFLTTESDHFESILVSELLPAFCQLFLCYLIHDDSFISKIMGITFCTKQDAVCCKSNSLCLNFKIHARETCWKDIYLWIDLLNNQCHYHVHLYKVLVSGVYKLLNAAYLFIKAEEGMEIEDRVAFACKYLPDNKVG